MAHETPCAVVSVLVCSSQSKGVLSQCYGFAIISFSPTLCILHRTEVCTLSFRRRPRAQIGTCWDQNLWSPPTSLTRFDLDAAVPDGRPCLLYRRCWHAIAANSAAIRAAGIDADKMWPSAPPPRPPPTEGDGGREDAEQGEFEEKYEGGRLEGVEVDDARRLTGLFREGSMRLVESAVTAPSFETRCVADGSSLT